MIKKLVKHGNSFALIIDRAILELLKIELKTPLDVSTDGRLLVVAPVQEAQKRERFNRALKKVNRKFGPLLKRLAE